MFVLDLLGTRVDLLLLLRSDSLSLVFGLHSLGITDVLVLLHGQTVKFAGTLVLGLAQLLTHDLMESRITSTRHNESSFRLLVLDLFGLLFKLGQTGSVESSRSKGLPLHRVKRLELETIRNNLIATCREKVNKVVNLDSLPVYSRHKSLAVRSPFNSDGAS